MRQIRTLMLAVFALFAFGALASAVANAEDGQPAVLVLSGNVENLKFEGTGGKSTLSVLESTISLAGTGVSAKLKGCLKLESKETDTNLCHEGLIEFTGVKTNSNAACRSETLTGTQDPVETVLAKLDTHLDAEEAVEPKGELQPLLVSRVLGVDASSTTSEWLKINCGTVVTLVLGKIGCLVLPGLKELAETEKAELLCKTDLNAAKEPNGDQLTGKCNQTATLCKELEEEPFGALFFKKGEEKDKMAAMLLHIEGTFNNMIFIDD